MRQRARRSAQTLGAMQIAIVNVIGIALALAGCDTQPDRAISATLTVQAGTSSSPAEIVLAQKIISARLDQFLTEPQSTITSNAEGKSLHFDFHGIPPDERTVTLLAKTPGELRLSLANFVGEAWITDSDIEDARLVRTDQGAMMDVHLGQTAGQRLFALTSKNVGRAIQLRWNGELIMTATSQSPFGETFQFSAPTPPDGLIMRVILQHGRLPITVESAEYRLAPNKSLERTREE